MVELKVELTGEAEKFYYYLRAFGLSDKDIIAKSLKALQMVDKEELVKIEPVKDSLILGELEE